MIIVAVLVIAGIVAFVYMRQQDGGSNARSQGQDMFSNPVYESQPANKPSVALGPDNGFEERGPRGRKDSFA